MGGWVTRDGIPRGSSPLPPSTRIGRNVTQTPRAFVRMDTCAIESVFSKIICGHLVQFRSRQDLMYVKLAMCAIHVYSQVIQKQRNRT
jgi:hypothetical protein